MTIKPEGRKMLRIEKKNAESPIEQKPRWIRNQVRT
ncbi:MAG TPA: lipoyl synthase, partial [Corynebacterium sp.]|nr:lipoyl synthase [Corynebacterium sp.]